MLFPLGFGFWPRVVPIAILAIFGICVVWSFSYFPVLREIDARAEKETKTLQTAVTKNMLKLISEVCMQKFPGNKYCTTESLTKREKLIGGNTKHAEKVDDYLVQYQTPIARWPAEAKARPEYKDIMHQIDLAKDKTMRIAADAGMTTRTQSGWFHLLRATFTHNDYMHLFGNMLMLIIFGIWVEQREGALFTGATFIMGSVVGLATQLVLFPQSPILGASAGITALMGAFIVFFYRADFNFLFMIPPVYFKKLTIPLLWVFPFLYLASDLIGGASTESHVAHAAHLTGFAIGMGMAAIYKQLQPLPDGAFFPQELAALARIRKSSKPEVLWPAFRDLMRWNMQNRVGLIEFLKRARATELPLNDEGNRQALQSALLFTAKKVLRHGSVGDVLQFLKAVPDSIPVKELITQAPLSQVLHLADMSAQEGKYVLAFGLYKYALELTEEDREIDLITDALKSLQKLHKARSTARVA